MAVILAIGPVHVTWPPAGDGATQHHAAMPVSRRAATPADTPASRDTMRGPSRRRTQRRSQPASARPHRGLIAEEVPAPDVAQPGDDAAALDTADLPTPRFACDVVEGAADSLSAHVAQGGRCMTSLQDVLSDPRIAQPGHCSPATLLVPSRRWMRAAPPHRRYNGACKTTSPGAFCNDEPQLSTAHARLWEEVAADADLAHAVEFVYADDGSHRLLSDVLAAAAVPASLRLVVAELQMDVGFNSGGARNTGAAVASGNVLLFSDMDSLPTVHQIRDVVAHVTSGAPWRWSYVAGAVDANDDNDNPLPDNPQETGEYNHFVATRADFVKAGGYWEDLAPLYGGEDSLLKSCAKRLYAIDVLPWAVHRRHPELKGIRRPTRQRDLQVTTQEVSNRLARYEFCNTGDVLRVPYRVALVAAGA